MALMYHIIVTSWHGHNFRMTGLLYFVPHIYTLLWFLGNYTMSANSCDGLNLQHRPSAYFISWSISIYSQGAAALWYNARRNGEIEYDSQHAGCPVLLGEKWGEWMTSATMKLLDTVTSQERGGVQTNGNSSVCSTAHSVRHQIKQHNEDLNY